MDKFTEFEDRSRVATKLTGQNRFMAAVLRTSEEAWESLLSVWDAHTVDDDELFEAARVWAKAHHIDDEWGAGWALGILLNAINSDETEDESRRAQAEVDEILVGDATAPFRFRAFDPAYCSEKRYSIEIQEAFRQWLPKYIAERAVEAERKGLVRTREKRNLDHYYWLARFQVNGETIASICEDLNHFSADGKPLTRQAVAQAIERTAEEIGLALRKDT